MYVLLVPSVLISMHTNFKKCRGYSVVFDTTKRNNRPSLYLVRGHTGDQLLAGMISIPALIDI